MSDRPDFTIEIHQNPFLPVDGREVHAIARVAAADPAVSGTRSISTAEIIIVDTSASMVGERLVAAKRAARAAVDALREGVDFAVVAGSHKAAMVYPRDPVLARATDARRADAKQAISGLAAAGGTRIGRWLTLADTLFADYRHGIRHATLLTDGKNEHESRAELDGVLARCADRFVCDCRGVGADWEPAELRQVASTLLGGFGMVPDPDDLAGDFTKMIEKAMGKAVADVSLRVWTPARADLRVVKQVYPYIRDLSDRRVDVGQPAEGPATGDYATGIWGAEKRDYHLWITVPAGAPGQNILAARVSVVLPGAGDASEATLAAAQVLAEWTEDEERTARRDPSVAHYAKQEELAQAVQEGLEAYERGDGRTAGARLLRGGELARETGHDQISSLVDKFVEPSTGMARPKDSVDEADKKMLDTESSEAARLPPPADGAAE